MESKRIHGINIYYDKSDTEKDVSDKFDDAIEHLEGLEGDEFNEMVSYAKKKDSRKTRFEIGYIKTKFEITYDGMHYNLELVE